VWPDGRIQDLFGIELPVIQAPMAGAGLSELAVAVAEAGGLYRPRRAEERGTAELRALGFGVRLWAWLGYRPTQQHLLQRGARPGREEKIGSRSVSLCRLPTARVSQLGWSIAPDWNRWVAAEHLAADRPRLESLAAAYGAKPTLSGGWAEISARLAFSD
jgi:hypothetical protein